MGDRESHDELAIAIPQVTPNQGKWYITSYVYDRSKYHQCIHDIMVGTACLINFAEKNFDGWLPNHKNFLFDLKFPNYTVHTYTHPDCHALVVCSL